MPGPTRPTRRLPISAILAIAAATATACVLAIPPAQPLRTIQAGPASTTPPAAEVASVREAVGPSRTADEQISSLQDLLNTVEATVTTP